MGSNATELFPREVFDQHLHRYGKFGLTMAIMVLPIFTSKSDDIPDMDAMAEKMQSAIDNGTQLDESEINFTSSKTVNVYNERMLGVFQDMYDLKYF